MTEGYFGQWERVDTDSKSLMCEWHRLKRWGVPHARSAAYAIVGISVADGSKD